MSLQFVLPEHLSQAILSLQPVETSSELCQLGQAVNFICESFSGLYQYNACMLTACMFLTFTLEPDVSYRCKADICCRTVSHQVAVLSWFQLG